VAVVFVPECSSSAQNRYLVQIPISQEPDMPSTFFINPRSNPELRSLFEISMLPQMNNLQDYFLAAMAILSNHFPIGYSALILQEAQKDSLRVEAVYGVEKEVHPSDCSGRKGIIGKVLEARQPMVILSLNQEPFYSEVGKGPKRIEKIHFPMLCIPLIVDNEPIGVMNTDSLYGPRGEFNEDFQFFSILTAILSPVIKNYQVKREDLLHSSGKSKAKSPVLEEILGEKLTEVINRIDPYVESKNKMSLFDDIIAVVEKILIKSALVRVGYVQIAAAQLLGINRNTLRKKMKDLKIKTK
jgi:transcriptional regulator with GAF, ATPase, and Fis domain